MPSPTVVIVPAACQTRLHYRALDIALTDVKLLSTVVTMPSVGSLPSIPDFTRDVAAVRQVVTGLLDEGKDVVVLMHSYGGIPGSAALEGLSKGEREVTHGQGASHVVRLVYVAAHVLREGEKMIGAADLDALRKFEGFNEEAGTILVTQSAARAIMFHDLSPDHAMLESQGLQPSSLGALWSAQTYTAWKDIPSTYVMCTLDRVVPLAHQEGMVANAKEVAPEAFDVTERLESGHEPIISKVNELAECVKRAAGL